MSNNQEQDFRLMTAETIGKDLLGALLGEIRLLPKPWPQLSQGKQDDIIERLRKRVDNAVKMAVHILAADGRTVVAGDLDQITIKDGVKAVVKFGANAANLHEMYEASGKAVLVVVANHTDYTGGMDEVSGEPDQRAMDLGHEYHDNDGGGMDDPNVVDAEFVVDAPALPAPGDESVTEEQKQAAFDEGYSAAGRGEPESACPVMKGELCIAWVKGFKAWHELEGDGQPPAVDGNDKPAGNDGDERPPIDAD